MLHEQLMVLCFSQFYTQDLNMLTIHFSCSLHIPTVIYIFDMFFNKLYSCWLNVGVYLGTWGRLSWYVPGSCSVPLYKERMRVSALASLLWVSVSTQNTRCMHKHSCKIEHDITGASCDDIRYYMMMFHWCRGFQMMTFTSVLKGV